jgi:hypothetical protein
MAMAAMIFPRILRKLRNVSEAESLRYAIAGFEYLEKVRSALANVNPHGIYTS